MFVPYEVRGLGFKPSIRRTSGLKARATPGTIGSGYKSCSSSSRRVLLFFPVNSPVKVDPESHRLLDVNPRPISPFSVPKNEPVLKLNGLCFESDPVELNG